MHTPVSIYLKVRDMYPQSALMESSDYHAGENSLSFIALCPLASIGVNGGIVTANYPDNSRTEEPLTKTFNVEKAMNRFINQFQVTGDNKNVCGLYGYTTFNAVKYFEHIPVKESHDEQNDAPDLLYILYKYVIVFNHFKNELTLVEMLSEGEESGLPELEAAIENRNYASYNFSVCSFSNFKAFHCLGLWLAVKIIPPHAPSMVTANSVVGVDASPIFTTSNPIPIKVPHTTFFTISPEIRASRPTTILLLFTVVVLRISVA